jgi:beta-glucanase (GH16 family)
MNFKKAYNNLTIIFSAIILTAYLPGKAQSCYELVWSDEFNYTGLPDSTNWTHEVGGSGWGNNELQYYTEKRTENARVEDGKLIIEAREESYQGSDYTSARLITYPSGNYWQYGKIEARMKLPYGQGIWPAFWMLGRNFFEGTGWPACGEIDIMEMIGGGEGRDDKVHGTIHWDNNGHAQYGGSKQLSEGIFADAFHVFSIEWDDTEIRWFLDGVQYHIVDITPSHMTELHQQFFLILNIAVGGNWPGNPNASTVFPQTMEIDYIRVYQQDVTPEIQGDTLVVAGSKSLTYSVVESDSLSYNWIIPEEAVLLDGQGTHEITVDWGCDTGTVVCELTTECQEYVLTRKVGITDMKITGKEIVDESEAGLQYSVADTREATYSWIFPDGVAVNSNPDSNSINIDWIDKDGVIKLSVDNLCGTDSALKQIYVLRQLPFPDPTQPHLIPGAISSTHYDYGGEGVAYHDNDAANQGPGPRQEEGVDTEYNDGGENVGWILTGEWLEYTVEVEESKTYDVEIRVASPNNSGKLSLSFNGTNVSGDISVPSTGAWDNFASIYVKDIQINDNDTILRVDIVNGGFNMGQLLFADSIPTTHVRDIENKNDLFIYPTVASTAIFVENITREHNYSVSDLTGRIVKNGTLSPGSFIPVDDLTQGIYFLILDDSENLIVSGKFYKVE